MRRIARFYWIVILLILVVWVLYSIPFSQKIQQKVAVKLYQNGTEAGNAIVSVDGERTNYLFHDDHYFGAFVISTVAKTEGLNAEIELGGKSNVQRLYYTASGTIFDDLVCSEMIVNDDLTQFALTLKDGTTLATSDEVYRIYTEHIDHDLDTGVTTVQRIIPAF